MKKKLIALLLLPLVALSQAGDWAMGFDEDWAAASAGPVTLTFTYVSTYPASISLYSLYAGPADPSKAFYNAGEGWLNYTGKTITVLAPVVKFKGDWRTSTGTFAFMFRGTFRSPHPVRLSGGFDVSGQCVMNIFYQTFYICDGFVGGIPPKLFGRLSGTPARGMFRETFRNCTNLEGPIPSGLFGDISGSPAFEMFSTTFYACTSLSGKIPVGLFGNISGSPAGEMFVYTFYNCQGLNGESALMPDGTTHLYEQFPTASGTQCDNCYLGATGLNDYADIPVAWK